MSNLVSSVDLNLGQFDIDKVKVTVSYYLRTTYNYHEEISVEKTENPDSVRVDFTEPLDVPSKFILEQRIQDYMIESMKDSNHGLI
ncbi:hypothetical protein LIS04_129 [Listeria phage LIS04]|nr:hypothetical protein LIS04_129 [Listeria phage LIS04]